MRRRPGLLWRVGLLQTWAESWGLGALLTLGLLAAGEAVPSNALGQGFFFLSAICALWAALRLRLPPGRWWARLLRDALAALGLSLALGIGLPVLAWLLGWGDRLARSNLGVVGVGLVLAAGGIGFAALRVGVGLWRAWDRLRRRRMLWALTHAHLTVVVVLALLIATLAGVQVVTTVSEMPARFSPDRAAAFVDLLTRTLFPFASIVAAMVVVLLVILLPPSALFSYLVARRTTRRLEALAAAAAALRRGDLAARVPVAGEDEVAQLQADFNAMAADLERATRGIQAERDKVLTLLQARRDLLASVSHELRTPVATLRGYLESALAEDADAAGSDLAGSGLAGSNLRDDLTVMQGEVARLQRLIDDLFTLARAEVDGLALDLRPVAVGTVVQERVAAMAPLAWRSARVEVVAEVPAPALPPALADPERLAQIVVNLLRNAVRHTPPGGIVAAVVAAEAAHVRIEVRDTGEGIPPEELAHVWERFYRGAGARRKDDRGAGLGLALVKELTEAMGGTVAVESVVGQGSCFTVRLPNA